MYKLRILARRNRYEFDAQSYDDLLRDIQRFRGSVYKSDGAIPDDELQSDGRYVLPGDEDHWHLFMVLPNGQIAACLRLACYERDVTFEQLSCHNYLSRLSVGQLRHFRDRINDLIDSTDRAGLTIGEVGGWAVDEMARRSIATIMLPLACWALYGILGHSIVVSTATTRHGSATILKKLGGFPIFEGDSGKSQFFDEYHGCDIEIVLYDSRAPAAKYIKTVEAISNQLRSNGFKNGVAECSLMRDRNEAACPTSP